MRRLASVFGSGAAAAAAALSGMFLGMAIGSAAFGRGAGRSPSPLRAFGLLEIGVGCGALLSEPILLLWETLFPELYRGLHASPATFLGVRTGLSMAALILPTILMGATFPYLAEALSRRGGRPGAHGAGLQAANALGGAAGALAVPFALLPLLGARGSLAAAAASSFAVGASALLLARGRAPASAPLEGIGPPAAPRRVKPLLLGLAFVSGAVLFAHEVFAARMFALVHENSSHAFAIIVAIFIAGLSAGAALARALLLRGWGAGSILALSWAACGVLLMLTPRLLDGLTAGPGPSPGGALIPLAGAATAVLLPATISGGMGLPAVMDLALSRSGAATGPVLGKVLAANGIGCAAGPLIALAALAGGWGIGWSLHGAGLLLAGLGIACSLFLGARGPLLTRGPLGVAALAAAGFLLAPGDLPRLRRASAGEKVICLRESINGTVAVLEDAERRWVEVNGFYIIGGTASAGDERHQAHLPLLLHPSPRSAAFLGLGTGITAGAALLHPLGEIAAIEILPDVAHAAVDHFADANGNLGADPRVEIVVGDARSFLEGSGRAFDVIVGDLFVPWRPGEASLYTLEQFRAARKALREGGLFCQWLPLFQLSAGDYRSIAASFVDVFPRTTVWRGDFFPNTPALALVGHTGEGSLDAGAVLAAGRALAPKLDRASPYLAHPSGIWLFLAGPLDARALAGERRNRDGFPAVELSSPAGSLTRRRASFVGRELERYLDGLRAASLEGTPLEGLGPDALRARDLGATLRRASLLVEEKKDAEGAALAREVLDALPREIREALTGG